jgi:6,7-dimethyl-8-ribityllumazine synthase
MDVIRGELDSVDIEVGIVVARYSAYITDKLLDGAIIGLKDHGISDDSITVAWVPGAFELPVMAQTMLELNNYDLIICLGAVIRGETPHFEYVSQVAATGISRVGLDYGVPVIFGVLTTDNQDQAAERAGGKLGNKGRESAIAGLQMASTIRQLQEKLEPADAVE